MDVVGHCSLAELIKLQRQEKEVILLPAYSPELNPIENLWHYLKSHHWSNQAYKDCDALEKAIIHAWKYSVLDTELMKTVCSAKIYERAEIM